MVRLETKPVIVPLEHPKTGEGGYQPLNPRVETLPEGTQLFPHQRSRPLPVPILVEHDVALKMRDGATLYCDIYRPASSGIAAQVPAILCSGPFGKKFNGLSSLQLMTPWNLGIPDGTLSGLERFEAPDPADWVAWDYAVVNLDTRGCGHSDGDMVILGTQEGEDGHDAVQAISQMEWCTGAVGMAGNSHLAITQWFVAAQQPPALKAIAPWEGCGDLYREQFARGGIYGGELFDNLIVRYMLRGLHGIESFHDMFYKQTPLSNDWWEDKRAPMSAIQTPAYVTGTWTNTMHGMGAIRAWRELNTDDKWLRWHGTQEWFDMWGNKEGILELKKFFDCFLKGLDNGWKTQTPRVRMALLRYRELRDPIEGIVEDDVIPRRTDHRTYYFAQNGELAVTTPAAGLVRYNSATQDSVAFSMVFHKATRLMGIPKAVLYMACHGHDDMDVFVIIEKLDRNGRPMLNLNIPWSAVPGVRGFNAMKPEEKTEVVLYRGPTGILRASLREVDHDRSMHPNWPYHPHRREQKVAPGEIVRLEIGIWAFGVDYEAGEGLQVRVSGQHMGISNFTTGCHVLNKDCHEVYLGGDYASHVVLPHV